MANDSPEKRSVPAEDDRLIAPNPDAEKIITQKLKHARHQLALPIQTLQSIADLGEVPEPFREMYAKSLGQVSKTIDHLLENARSSCDTGEFHTMIQAIMQDILGLHAKYKDLRCSIEPLPEQCTRFHMSTSMNGWNKVLTNCLENAHRKGAKNIRISFDCTKLQRIPAMKVCVEDDGEGINEDILAKIIAKQTISDKDEETARSEGKNPDDRGSGLMMVRDFIRESGGIMHVESVLREEDPQRPFATKFSFTLPLFVPKAIPSGPLSVTRRRFMAAAGGGLVATVGVGFAICRLLEEEDGDLREPLAHAPEPTVAPRPEHLEPETPEAPQGPSLSDVVFGPAGKILSFTLMIDGKSLTYERGKESEMLRKKEEIDLPNASIVTFRIARNDNESQRMFLYGTEQGLSGLLDISSKGKMLFAHFAVPREPDMKPVSVDTSNIHPLSDVLCNGTDNHAINLAFIRSAAIESISEGMDDLELKAKHERRANPSAHAVHRFLKNMLDMHRRTHARKNVIAETPDEWEKLRHGVNQLIVAQPPVVEYMRQHPCTPEDARHMRLYKNEVCLIDVNPNEAALLIPVLRLH